MSTLWTLPPDRFEFKLDISRFSTTVMSTCQRVQRIARIRPLETGPNPIRIARGQHPGDSVVLSITRRTWQLDDAIEGTTHDTYGRVEPLVRAVLEGNRTAVILQGCSGAGKTFTLFGGPSSPGLIELSGRDLLDAAADTATGEYTAPVWLTVYEYKFQGRKLLLHEPLSTAVELARVLQVIRRTLVTRKREDGSKDTSSRSWVCIELKSSRSGGALTLTDMPGKETPKFPDSIDVNGRVQDLLDGFKALDGFRCSDQDRSAAVFGKMNPIAGTHEHGGKVYVRDVLALFDHCSHVLVIGCLNPGDTRRAKTTLDTLAGFAGVTLKTAPAVKAPPSRRSPSPQSQPSLPLPTPRAPKEAPIAPQVISQAASAQGCTSSASAATGARNGLFVPKPIDEEHATLLQQFLRMGIEKLGATGIVSATHSNKEDGQKARSEHKRCCAELCDAIRGMPELVREVNEVIAHAYHQFRDRRHHLFVAMIEWYKRNERGVVTIPEDFLPAFASQQLERVQTKLLAHADSVYARIPSGLDPLKRALRVKDEAMIKVYMKMAGLEVENLRRTLELERSERRLASERSKHKSELSAYVVKLQGLLDANSALQRVVQQQEQEILALRNELRGAADCSKAGNNINNAVHASASEDGDQSTLYGDDENLDAGDNDDEPGADGK